MRVYYITLILICFCKQTNSQVIKLGNNSGNIINNGLIASDNERIYYSGLDSNYGLYSMRLDGTDIKKISSDYIEHVNVLDGWLYYRKVGGLYKMQTDGSHEQQLASGAPFYINVVNDWIFYVDNAAGDIWKIRTDGSGIQRLYCGYYDCLTTDGKSLYFAWYRDSVFKASFDGKHLTKILSGNIEHPFVAGDWLYYKTNYYKICRINTENFRVETLVADKNLGADYIILYNAELYFGCVDGIKKFNLQENAQQKLYDVRIIELGITANFIYFTTAEWDSMNERHTKTNLIKLDELASLGKGKSR